MALRFFGFRHLPERLPLTCTLAALVVVISSCGPSPRAETQSADSADSADAAEPVVAVSRPTPVATATPAQHPEAVPEEAADHANNSAPAARSEDAPLHEGATCTVAQVVELAAEHNPSRAVFEATRAAAAAQIQVARAWANPELAVSGGQASARVGGDRATIYGVALSQRFEFPGKRASRIEAARVGQELTTREIAIDALALEIAVRAACAELVAAEAKLAQTQLNAQAAEKVRATVSLRVTAREAEPGEEARAKLEDIIARGDRDRAARQVIAHRAAVRVWAGGGLPDTCTIADGLPTSLPVIERDVAIAVASEHNPRLGFLHAQADARAAELLREQRQWYPDLTLGGFSDRESDTNTLGVTVGIELPLWNRNQGGIAVANAERRQAQAQLRAEQQIIAREVELAWQMYESQRLVLNELLTEAKTAAQDAVDGQMAAFQAGEASLLDVLEARRAALAVDDIVLDARRTAAEARLALGQAMGVFTFPTTVSAGVQP